MIYHVYANRSNIGDWLSARGIQQLLAGEEIHECLCDAPFIEQSLAHLSEATPDDLIVIGGGGLFMDYFTPFWQKFRGHAVKAPFCIWGVGYCDWKRQPSIGPKALLQEIVNSSRVCVVRDQLSKDYLAECRLPAPVPCPAMIIVDQSILDQPPEQARGILHVDNLTIAGSKVYHVMDACGRAFAKHTGRTYQQSNNRIEAGSEAALASILRRYRNSDIVLSSALHGCIIAVSMGRKIIAVSGDRKIEAFMQAAGLGDWVLDVAAVNRLPDLFAQLSNQLPASKFVAWVRQKNRAVAATIRSNKTVGPT